MWSQGRSSVVGRGWSRVTSSHREQIRVETGRPGSSRCKCFVKLYSFKSTYTLEVYGGDICRLFLDIMWTLEFAHVFLSYQYLRLWCKGVIANKIGETPFAFSFCIFSRTVES